MRMSVTLQIRVFIGIMVFALTLPMSSVIAGGEVGSEEQQEQKETQVTGTQTTSEPVPTEAESQDAIDQQLAKYFDAFSLEPAINTYFVKGNRGRFREDWYTDDQTTGGVKDLTFRGKRGKVHFEFEGHALVDYDYLTRLRLTDKEKFFFNVEWKRFRKYWAGSEDFPWNPTQYRLGDQFETWPADNLHTDRDTVKTEYGWILSDRAKVILENEVWLRRGRETLLRGEPAMATGRSNVRGIPMRVRVDGVSDTVTLRAPLTLAKKHNVEPRVSFEFYQDSQFTDSARYNNGVLAQKRDYIDRYQFADLKAQLTYNSFLANDVYVHGGYLFNFLRNDSVRSEVRPNLAAPNIYVNPDVDNWRVSNAFSLGSLLIDFLKRKGLDLRLGFRGEFAKTDARGYLSSGGGSAPANMRHSDSNLTEGWFGQVVSLTFKGLKNTTAFLGVDMEQRRLRWREIYDARSHESVTVFGNTVLFPQYETYINYIDFVPKFKFTHRFNSRLKAGLLYRWQQRERQYHMTEDTDVAFYPGILGNGTRRVHEVIANFDVRLYWAWLMTYKYHMIVDNIEYNRADEDQQNLNRDTFSVAFSGPIGKKLFAYITGMYDLYRIDTPTAPTQNRWSPWKDKYDFNGDVAVIGTHLSYLLMNNVTLYASYQFTGSFGDNTNNLYEASAGLRYRVNPTTSFEARYQVFDFDDRRGERKYDDDYFGQGMFFAFKKAFA